MDQPKIERVLRLMKMMTGNVNYTVEDLAERLETSPRSIYRYIETFKDAGFVVQKVDGGVYRLGKESKYFKSISQLIHFTDEEAHIVNQLIEALDDTNMLKQNLRKKLTSVYNCTSMANSIVKGKNAININHIIEAIEGKRQVVLKNYASSHTGIIRDRLVEPFGFTTNYIQIWCYEPESGMNKLFNTARVGSVEVLQQEWQHTTEHREGYIDIFRMMGFEQKRVQLKVGVMARNLMTEEYPLSERDMTQIDDNHWLLDTQVCNYIGISRFVLGLMSDIEIVDSPEFEQYILKEVEHMQSRLQEIK
ncbi:MAG: WYL domain-containing protein [Rikenellaceae bacterium]|nr:WYL domain-containing protein [Rikenellaceae bacterium]